MSYFRCNGLALLLLPAASAACLWDRDTVQEELSGNWDLADTIVGRFERNPPLYYRMRLQRVLSELSANPDRLELYDDASVAADRLGEHDRAVELIGKKLEALKRLDPNGSNRDQWYRYNANAATFIAHRWFAKGADKKRIGELRQSVALLEKALSLNAEAHFGREKFQLGVIKWILYRLEKPEVNVGSLDYKILEWLNRPKAEERAKGYAGLIRLGNAWQSPDIFFALSSAIHPRQGAMRDLASFRVEELIHEGAKPLDTDLAAFTVKAGEDRLTDYRREEFRQLRRNADRWAKNREEFMLARLRLGKHPDTDPAFWSGYVEVPRLELRAPWWLWFYQQDPSTIYVALPAALILLLVVLYVLQERNKKRAKRRSAAEVTEAAP